MKTTEAHITLKYSTPYVQKLYTDIFAISVTFYLAEHLLYESFPREEFLQLEKEVQEQNLDLVLIGGKV